MIEGNSAHFQTCGYIEARINFEQSPGMWSTFWMMPNAYGPVGYPGTEMDIVEHMSNDNSTCYTGYYWDGYGANSHHVQQTFNLSPAWGYHVYGLAWDHDSYRFYLDNQLKWTFTDKISTIPETVILSSEVFDHSWVGDTPAGGYGDLAHSTTKTYVDYVHVYSLAVPEPSSLALLLSVVAMLSSLTWRNRKVQ